MCDVHHVSSNQCMLECHFYQRKGWKRKASNHAYRKYDPRVCENLPVKEFFIKNGVLIYSYSSLHKEVMSL